MLRRPHAAGRGRPLRGQAESTNLPDRKMIAAAMNSFMNSLPSLDEMHAVAQDAYASIPDELRRFVAGVVIRIADFPDDETIEEMELDSEYDLLGLYRGVAVGDKGGSYVAQDVDMIFLYRMPIIDYAQETGEDLQHVIRHVLIHEIGHHFGLSDDDMERIEESPA